MYDLKITDRFIIVGIKSRIVFFTTDGVVLHEIVIPSKVLPEVAASNGEQTTPNGNQPQLPAHVVTLEYCPSLKVLAVSLSDKSLRCYRLTEEDDGLSSAPLGTSITTTRTIVCLKFAPKHGVLFGSDKSDCFEYALFGADTDTNPKWILGHTSQILCLAVSEDGRFIITSDRDEKIKISCYPDCHNIECFCLGHLEYVGAMEVLPNGRLLSVSGDKTLRLWDYTVGKELFTHSLENPAVALTVQTTNDGTLCAVRSYVENRVEVAHVSSDTPAKCVAYDGITLNADITILSVVLNACLQLILLATEKESKRARIMVYDFNNDRRQFAEVVDHPLGKSFETQFKHETIDQVRDYSTLFKNSIDNLSEYFERKKQKIGSKKSK